ncbi:MAG: alanine--tRNA ligase [Caldilineaceae bacterium]|nr:alanine--tRNA ligase [Caldilineaceae bacterium]MDE0339188.1 alanine--tRNA ligase [Caldilineaceae bacterium]
MKSLSTFEIRKRFLEYFQERSHQIVDSSSLVPADDPTLLFVNAGMVQFKDLLLGLEKRGYNRATTSQKCLRVSGKHNDLENVGPSPRHHTFFEMLGNFSFGDYFKRDAIQFAWDLLVNELGLSLDRLWFSVYTDDDEAAQLWREVGAPPERILRFGKKDNWWEMGDVGPCGPCTEIHYYWGDLEEQVADGVNVDDEYLEIWNLVFMQYEQREPGGELIPLPKPSVDTGAGLERLASILQGKDNNYDTDAFTPIMDRIQELLGHSDAQRQEHLVGYRVIADHGRAITFLITDGVMPGNEGRDYVVRMILRRAARFGKLIGFEDHFLAEICRVVIAEFGAHYKVLQANEDFIVQTVTAEEERFQRALTTGLSLLDGLMDRLRAGDARVIPGEDAFRLWDTYGFPLDITKDVAQENGFEVDEAGYQAALEQQRRQSGSDQQGAAADVSVYVTILEALRGRGLLGTDGVRNLIYENAEDAETTVIGLVKDGQPVEQAHAGEEIEVILPETPFYVESGGQVSDTGEIEYFPEDMQKPVWSVQIQSMRRPIPGLLVHVGKVTSGTIKVEDPACAFIDTVRRWDVMRNHTATHLLHAELRGQLGEHVRQRGSLVAPDRLRFDFSHPQPVSTEQLRAIEQAANQSVLANYPVKDRWTGFDRAVAEGALAFFEEKYEDTVRVISIGNGGEAISQELCGGTHVGTTGEIGPFLITSEGSSAAGVRRIEALTGRAAQAVLTDRLAALDTVAAELRVQPEQTVEAVQRLQEQNRQLDRELERTRAQLSRQQSETLLDHAVRMNGLAVLAEQVEANDVDALRQMTDWFRDRLGSSVVVLGSVINEKPMLVAAATDDAIKKGIHAGNLVRDAAKIVGGGGGGRPNMAQAGGRHADKLPEALGQVAGWVEANLG